MTHSNKKKQQRAGSRKEHPTDPPPPSLPSICVYCQSRPADTVAHVVARCFFENMVPTRGITVPACRECNEGRGDGGVRPLWEDEQYTRTVLASEQPGGDGAAAASLPAEKIQRSSDGNGLAAARTDGRIVIPDVPLMPVEGAREARVLAKIVRGLFYAMNHRPLPRQHPVYCSGRLGDQEFLEVHRAMKHSKDCAGWWGMGDQRDFSFKCTTENEQSVASLWLLVFYQRVAFFAHTLPLEPAATGKRLARRLQ